MNRLVVAALASAVGGIIAFLVIEQIRNNRVV